MFVDLYDYIRGYENVLLLNEVLSKTEIERMRTEIGTPEILPCTFDVSIPGWLERIGLWGKIDIRHKNPEKWRGKKKVTQAQFIKGLMPDKITQYFGKWEFIKKGLTKVECQRTYFGIDGKKYVERFLVTIKLKRELR